MAETRSDGKVQRLQRENRRLKRKLEQDDIMLEIPKKASEMMRISRGRREPGEES